MQKVINRTHIEGLLYQHSLELRESGPNSTNPGTKYITGSFNIVSYNIDSDTLLKLTVKSVEVGGKELPINTSSSFRFGR